MDKHPGRESRPLIIDQMPKRVAHTVAIGVMVVISMTNLLVALYNPLL